MTTTFENFSSAGASAAELLSYDEASTLVQSKAAICLRRTRHTEYVPLPWALGRTLASAVLADRDQPPFDRSLRDGYACRAAEINLHKALPVRGGSRAGDAPAKSLPAMCVWEIMTGAAVPPGADAVLMVEHAEWLGSQVRMIPGRQLVAGENTVLRGTQSQQGDELLAAGTAIGYAQIALAASAGCSELNVYSKPRVAILTTGDELVSVASTPPPGKIRDSSTAMLAALIESHGGAPTILPTAPDDPEAMDKALEEAASADLLLIAGGVSAGKFDFVEPALLRRGAQLFMTGVRMQPGKPVVFGEMPGSSASNDLQDALPVFGLPGNPISSAVTFMLFAAPMIAALSGRNNFHPRFALAKLGFPYTGKRGLTRFLPAFCDFDSSPAGSPVASPVHCQGSGDLTALSKANCFVVIPEDTVATGAGTIVRILLI